MSGPKKHVGKIKTTDQRCVVVFMQIPGEEDHALVILTDALPPRYEQNVIDLVNSPEGQSETVFANLLSRRVFPDTGQQVLTALHQMNQLARVPVDNVIMLPLPNQPIPLRTVLQLMGNQASESKQTNVPAQDAMTKVNPYGNIQEVEASENNRGVAQNLLVEAQILEQEAEKKREQAYRYAPDLRPTEAVISIKEKAVGVKPRKTRSRTKS